MSVNKFGWVEKKRRPAACAFFYLFENVWQGVKFTPPLNRNRVKKLVLHIYARIRLVILQRTLRLHVSAWAKKFEFLLTRTSLFWIREINARPFQVFGKQFYSFMKISNFLSREKKLVACKRAISKIPQPKQLHCQRIQRKHYQTKKSDSGRKKFYDISRKMQKITAANYSITRCTDLIIRRKDYLDCFRFFFEVT